MLSRRFFLKHLGLASVLFGSSYVYATPKRFTKLTTLKVAGLQYGECSDSIFNNSDVLTLVREPHNPYDKYAVVIYKEKQKVGYIPRTNSRIIASLIDAGEKIEAKVRYFHPHKEPWERLWISLYRVG